MANDLQTTTGAPIVELMRLTTPLISSALADSPYATAGQPRWRPEWALRVFERENVNPAILRAETDRALTPVAVDWLADRLRLLWKSSAMSGSLDATAWLHETTRLLRDLPQSVLAWAIDEAVRKSERGFMPTVGEIRVIAEPMAETLRRNLRRLEAVCSPGKPTEEGPLPKDQRCTPEEAAEIRRACGIKYDDDAATRHADWIPVEQRAAPTREDYLRWGIDPDAPEDPTPTTQEIAA
jgi:hypothetical protein